MLGSVVRTALLAATMSAPSAAPFDGGTSVAFASPVPIATVSAAPPSAALKEIGRVRVTSPLCKALVGDAVRAIDIETQNGRRIGAVTTFLHDVDLDSNEIVKHRGTQELTRRFVELRAAAVEGNSVIKHFREASAGAPTQERRTALEAFANALDGALHRQKVLADDVGRLVAYLDSHEPIDKDTHDAMVFNALLREADARYPRTAFDVRAFGPIAGVPDPLSTTARYASDELIARAQPIANDESDAAQRVDPAFEGC